MSTKIQNDKKGETDSKKGWTDAKKGWTKVMKGSKDGMKSPMNPKKGSPTDEKKTEINGSVTNNKPIANLDISATPNAGAVCLMTESPYRIHKVSLFVCLLVCMFVCLFVSGLGWW